MGRKANQKISLFTKCHCGLRGDYLINSGNDLVCRNHFDVLIKEGKEIPTAHYVTQDGYKVVQRYDRVIKTHPIIQDGQKIWLLDGDYELVKA